MTADQRSLAGFGAGGQWSLADVDDRDDDADGDRADRADELDDRTKETGD